MTITAPQGPETANNKVIDMIHRAEALYGCCLASSYEGKKQLSGTYFIDTVLPMPQKSMKGKRCPRPPA
jgi:hypothetical protein